MGSIRYMGLAGQGPDLVVGRGAQPDLDLSTGVIDRLHRGPNPVAGGQEQRIPAPIWLCRAEQGGEQPSLIQKCREQAWP